ncbi:MULTISPECIES: ArsR/SmtB family transcription factor [unclassified Thermotoga]|uniref:Transcriptional regulator, ArsR family n=1 Tax=Thermotoga petrophila TaxID=93929 RepID=A0A101EQ47_9THEM|nr:MULTISPECIES: metalloregulator ArsR/SmtB family transcription factor [unclassified Thermotoga]KUK22813.1 MAG: Transcriptional regulator, ArsR family [Thermotoga petrophila]AIY89032.1 ArsR family transcriptional regulator [Thermotoga sp. Cell2]KHC93201.1 ArsR family transcriptional regulator [Thermotoga sp. TBGT1765]KHC94609.1 ArsR family transcriptional regulator [Thermotoga sp. TBGT1766]KHC95948.1 ArsR family transcriptional regulator [Thermotoga sp. Xyl54]
MKLHELFHILSNETRLKILTLLLEKEMCVCQILASTGTTQPNISQHLNILKNHGIVKSRREDSFVYYSIDERFLEKYPFLITILERAGKEYGVKAVNSCSLPNLSNKE